MTNNISLSASASLYLVLRKKSPVWLHTLKEKNCQGRLAPVRLVPLLIIEQLFLARFLCFIL